jgi:hypothetical protein
MCHKMKKSAIVFWFWRNLFTHVSPSTFMFVWFINDLSQELIDVVYQEELNLNYSRLTKGMIGPNIG